MRARGLYPHRQLFLIQKEYGYIVAVLFFMPQLVARASDKNKKIKESQEKLITP